MRSGRRKKSASVFAALMEASAPLDAQSIAKSFRQGSKAEPAITRVLASLARLGHVQSGDGGTFALRRSMRISALNSRARRVLATVTDVIEEHALAKVQTAHASV